MLTQERLKELLHYDPETGVFTARVNRGSVQIGAKAGGENRGYIRIGVKNKKYFAHRLAWFYVHGCWPSKELDHINGKRPDNRLSNLREATRAQNNSNRPVHRRNEYGKKGAYFIKNRNKWRALIGKDKRLIHLGYFDSAEEAQAAYIAAARTHYGEFARAE